MDQEDVILPDAPAAGEVSSSDSEAAPGSVKATATDHSDKENNNLEDMFDDDDENEEYSSSTHQSSLQQSAQGSLYV